MILKSEHIAKSYGRKHVLEDISFQLDAGTLTGIVGENGSGKSTLMKIIVGEQKADHGKICLEGKIGYCPQEVTLFPQLTVVEHFKYFSVAYGVPEAILNQRSQELMDHFNFNQYQLERVDNLSGGTKQKLNLSLALLHDPDLLILDEPYNGFDWDTYQKFWRYTNHLKDRECAILIVTHFLNEKERFDHIFQLNNGLLE